MEPQSPPRMLLCRVLFYGRPRENIYATQKMSTRRAEGLRDKEIPYATGKSRTRHGKTTTRQGKEVRDRAFWYATRKTSTRRLEPLRDNQNQYATREDDYATRNSSLRRRRQLRDTENEYATRESSAGRGKIPTRRGEGLRDRESEYATREFSRGGFLLSRGASGFGRGLPNCFASPKTPMQGRNSLRRGRSYRLGLFPRLTSTPPSKRPVSWRELAVMRRRAIVLSSGEERSLTR